MSKLPHCQGCPLFSAPGPVWGEGSRADAKFIYIGQNPGSQEVAVGRPFIGPSGNVLARQLIEAGGIRRSEIYITNQVKCATPNNRIPTPEEVKHCKPILAAELKACKADTVVLSGALAFKENIGTYSTYNNYPELGGRYVPSDNIMNRRGCVEIKDGRKWIGTIHPAFIMRMPEFKHVGVDDLRKAYKVAHMPLSAFELSFNLYPTRTEIDEFVTHLIENCSNFADDVETHGLDDVDEDDYVGGQGEFDICGISDGRKALVVGRQDTHLLTPVFEQPNLIRDEHNGPFDHYHITQVIPEPLMKNKRFDTMLGAHYYRSFAPKKLKPYILSVHTFLPYYSRDIEKVNRRFYNALDVLATAQAGRDLRRLHEKWKITEVFENYGMPILPILEEIRAEGCKVDLRKLFIFRKFIQGRIDRASLLISKICGPLFNYNSPKQLCELLYTKWGLPKQYNTRGKEEPSLTTDFEARKRLRTWIEKSGEKNGRYKIPFYFLVLMDYISGEEQKLTFLDRVSSDGRIHFYYKAHGQHFFRLSSKPNIQNWPIYDITDWGGARGNLHRTMDDPTGVPKTGELGSLRSLIVPDQPDHWILSADFAQLQLWIYAFQFKVKWLMQMFESKDYLYGIVYEKLYKPDLFFDPAKVKPGQPRTKDMKMSKDIVPEQRIRRAKAVPLGFLFGRTADAVAEEYGWTLKEGQELRNWWYGLNPELLKSYDHINYLLKQQGWIRHIFGNIIQYPNMKITEAINSHAQCPEAFIMIGSIIKVQEELKRRGLRAKGNRIMLTVHDSLTLNVTEEDAEEVYEDILAPTLNRPIKELGGVCLRHEAEMSKAWDWKTISYEQWKLNRAASRASSANAGSS